MILPFYKPGSATDLHIVLRIWIHKINQGRSLVHLDKQTHIPPAVAIRKSRLLICMSS